MYIAVTYTIGQLAIAGVALIAAAYLTYVRAFKRYAQAQIAEED